MDLKPHKKRGQGVVHVSDLFQKYLHVLRAPQGTVIHAFIEAVEAVCGVTILKTHCAYTVSSRTIIYKGSGMIKSEILLHKREILNRMQESIGEKSIPLEIL